MVKRSRVNVKHKVTFLFISRRRTSIIVNSAGVLLSNTTEKIDAKHFKIGNIFAEGKNSNRGAILITYFPNYEIISPQPSCTFSVAILSFT